MTTSEEIRLSFKLKRDAEIVKTAAIIFGAPRHQNDITTDETYLKLSVRYARRLFEMVENNEI